MLMLQEIRFEGPGLKIPARDIWLGYAEKWFCQAWKWEHGKWQLLTNAQGPLSQYVRPGDRVRVERGWYDGAVDILDWVSVYDVFGT